MTLKDFLSIMEKYFDYKVPKIGDVRKTKNDADRLLVFLNAFISEENDEKNPIEAKKDETLRKIYSGHDNLSNIDANYYLSRLSSNAFYEFSLDLEDDDTIQNLIEDFNAYSESISETNYVDDITEVLKKILQDIAHPKLRRQLRKAVFISKNKVKIGNEIINIPDVLLEDNIQPSEYKYVDALIEVYAIDAKIPVKSLTVDTLNRLNPIYSTHFKLQREFFFKAESAYHILRDNFSDGEKEFEQLKNETLKGVSSTLFDTFDSPFKKVNATLKHVTLLTYGKSYLGRNDNGFVGADEKQGIIHMLVNDGKIVWVQ